MAKKKTAAKKEATMDERILGVLEGMQTSIDGIKDKLKEHDLKFAQQEHTAVPRPKDFQAATDESVSPLISRTIREILGNDVGINAEEIMRESGELDQVRLHVTIPEKYHTKGQFNAFHQQREEVTRDENGRIVKREIVPFTIVDRRTIGLDDLTSSAAKNKVHAWALKIAEQIRSEHEKAKLPPPNFFD